MSLREGGLIGRRGRLSEDVAPLGSGAKRVFDVVTATIGLTLLSPLILVVYVAIKFNSRGPVFIRETEYGYNNRAIHVLKFRCATTSAEADSNSHVTHVGGVLRRTGIDQLPQLINVLLGDMSIVGPRPSTSPQHLYDYGLMPTLAGVKPGMTREVRISEFRHGFDAMEQCINDDLHYATNWSLLLDIKIIFAALFSER